MPKVALGYPWPKIQTELVGHGQEEAGKNASLYKFWTELQKHYLSLHKISDHMIFIYLSYLFIIQYSDIKLQNPHK